MYGTVLIQTCFICHSSLWYCVLECWDRTQDCCDFGIRSQDTLTPWLDLIRNSARSHPPSRTVPLLNTGTYGTTTVFVKYNEA
jgi:hypothetical protein